MTSRPPPLTSNTLSRPSVKTSRNSMSVWVKSRTKYISKPKYTETSVHIGFMWQGVGSGEVAGTSSARRDQGLPPCQTEPVSAGSKTNPPLPKAEPVSDAGGTRLHSRTPSQLLSVKIEWFSVTVAQPLQGMVEE